MATGSLLGGEIGFFRTPRHVVGELVCGYAGEKEQIVRLMLRHEVAVNVANALQAARKCVLVIEDRQAMEDDAFDERDYDIVLVFAYGAGLLRSIADADRGFLDYLWLESTVSRSQGSVDDQ